MLGRVIEVISGKRFNESLRKKIIKPLDLRDTSFYVPEGKRAIVWPRSTGRPSTRDH